MNLIIFAESRIIIFVLVLAALEELRINQVIFYFVLDALKIKLDELAAIESFSMSPSDS